MNKERAEPQAVQPAAQPVAPEPAWFACDTDGADFDVTFVKTKAQALDVIDPEHPDPDSLITPLYAEPINPKIKESLTDEQIDEACAEVWGSDHGGVLTVSLQRAVARAIEAKLKEGET